MKIKVKYMTQVKKIIGVSVENIEIDAPCTIQDFISNNLCMRYPKLKDLVLNSDHAIQKIILIFIGDTKIEADIPTNLKDGDEVTIMSPISGG